MKINSITQMINTNQPIRNWKRENEQKKEMIQEQKDTYDITKIMELHKKGHLTGRTKEESDYYWRMRQDNKELDEMLYQMDKAEVMKEMGHIQNPLFESHNIDIEKQKEKEEDK